MNEYNDTDFKQRISDFVSEILLVVPNFSKSVTVIFKIIYILNCRVCWLYIFFCRAENISDIVQYKDSVLKNWKSGGKHRRERTD